MPRMCSVCTHDQAHVINVALVQRDGYRTVAHQYNVSVDALKRHAKEHIPKLLARAKDAVEVAEAGTLLDRVEGLYKRTEAILEAAENNKEWPTALAAIRECRGNLELLGRVTKELQDAPTFNLYLSPEWLELRAVLVGALEPHQEAQTAVLRALEGGGNGRA